MSNNSNHLLYLGLFIVVIGIFLLIYSISIGIETHTLSTNVDIEYLASDTQMPSSEKYYKYLNIYDYLIGKLNKNKDLPIKNIACIYTDYAYDTVVNLDSLVDKKFSSDASKKEVSNGNIQRLYDILPSYSTCAGVNKYIEDLSKYIDNNKRTDDETLGLGKIPDEDEEQNYVQDTQIPDTDANPEENYRE